jgi:hypothetical protein
VWPAPLSFDRPTTSSARTSCHLCGVGCASVAADEEGEGRGCGRGTEKSPNAADPVVVSATIRQPVHGASGNASNAAVVILAEHWTPSSTNGPTDPVSARSLRAHPASGARSGRGWSGSSVADLRRDVILRHRQTSSPTGYGPEARREPIWRENTACDSAWCFRRRRSARIPR